MIDFDTGFATVLLVLAVVVSIALVVVGRL